MADLKLRDLDGSVAAVLKARAGQEDKSLAARIIREERDAWG